MRKKDERGGERKEPLVQIDNPLNFPVFGSDFRVVAMAAGIFLWLCWSCGAASPW